MGNFWVMNYINGKWWQFTHEAAKYKASNEIKTDVG